MTNIIVFDNRMNDKDVTAFLLSSVNCHLLSELVKALVACCGEFQEAVELFG